MANTLSRRGFLGLFGGAAAVAAVAPASLVELLEPKRTIMLPPAGGWPRFMHMGNPRTMGNMTAADFRSTLAGDLHQQHLAVHEKWKHLYLQDPGPATMEVVGTDHLGRHITERIRIVGNEGSVTMKKFKTITGISNV